MKKLQLKLWSLAEADAGVEPNEELRKSLKAQHDDMNRKMERAVKNMTFAEDEDLRKAMQVEYDALRTQRDRVRAELAKVPDAQPVLSTDEIVDDCMTQLEQLHELSVKEPVDAKTAALLVSAIDAKLFLGFNQVLRGKQKLNVRAGGVLTIGSSPPPVPLYEGPTDRVIIRKVIADGESVSPIPGCGASGKKVPTRTQCGQQ